MTRPSPTTRGLRVVTVVLLAMLLIGGVAPHASGTEAARNRRSPRALQSFSNTTPIAIPSNALAAPSTIGVSGLDAPVADVDVSLNVLTHPGASDLDILLVGPEGQMALIMSDAGGEAGNDSLTFSDQAPNQVASSDPLTSGTFQPTNYDFVGAPDTFPSPPAPVATPPSSSALAVFNGTNANGIWTLFINEQDNLPVETGTLGAGWSLRITTANGGPDTAPDAFRVKAGKTLTIPATGVLQNDSDPDGDTLSATLAGPPRKGKTELQPDGSFTYRAKKKAKGTDTFTYLAQDPGGLSTLETVTISIKKARKKRRR